MRVLGIDLKMRYAEAVEYLYQLQKFGANFGLEKTRALAGAFGNPHERLKFIHVAGTNGKGSTCAMLESIYRHSGYRVGLFTSPHLISFTERIQIDRRNIPEADVARLTEKIREVVDPNSPPTFFEFVTIMALLYFEEQKVDLVIWETGLGGRLDATNIVTPLASVITNVQFDHEKWLGNTLTEIAREKAGIIKKGVPVFTGVESEEAWKVIRDTAQKLETSICTISNSLRPLEQSLLGPHQVRNAMLAVAIALGLQKELPIRSASVPEIEGYLKKVEWPGRFDLRGRYILDGAHNLAGALALRLALETNFPGLRPAFIIGIFGDKDVAGMARHFAAVAGRIYTVSVLSDRAASAKELANRFREVAPGLRVEAALSLEDALKKTENEDRVVITGSLHFIGEAMKALGIGEGPANELGLNDWSKR